MSPAVKNKELSVSPDLKSKWTHLEFRRFGNQVPGRPESEILIMGSRKSYDGL